MINFKSVIQEPKEKSEKIVLTRLEKLLEGGCWESRKMGVRIRILG